MGDSYPALGPNGKTLQNINGLACGIELYLGKDVLEKDGELIPIQWKGFDSRISRYQGEILEKSKIQDRFRSKIDECTQDRDKIQSINWEELHQLFRHVFGVFHA